MYGAYTVGSLKKLLDLYENDVEVTIEPLSKIDSTDDGYYLDDRPRIIKSSSISNKELRFKLKGYSY